jgi:hypothetical protein
VIILVLSVLSFPFLTRRVFILVMNNMFLLLLCLLGMFILVICKLKKKRE